MTAPTLERPGARNADDLADSPPGSEQPPAHLPQLTPGQLAEHIARSSLDQLVADDTLVVGYEAAGAALGGRKTQSVQVLAKARREHIRDYGQAWPSDLPERAYTKGIGPRAQPVWHLRTLVEWGIRFERLSRHDGKTRINPKPTGPVGRRRR